MTSLLSSVLGFGTYESPIRDPESLSNLQAKEAEQISLDIPDSRLERVYLGYIKSFTHNYSIRSDSIDNCKVLRVAPSQWLKKFMLGIFLFAVITILLMLILGQNDAESFRILVRALALLPVAVFGIPTVLGWLYFNYCRRKIFPT